MKPLREYTVPVLVAALVALTLGLFALWYADQGRDRAAPARFSPPAPP